MKALRIASIIIPFIAISCMRDPIYNPSSKYRFEFVAEGGGQIGAELIEVLLYDSLSGKKVSETYMSPDGGYLYSIGSGTYDIVAFTMGSKRTQITYTKDISLLTAETKTLQSSPAKVILSPDNVWACTLKGVFIPSLSEADGEFLLSFAMEPLCESWKVRVTGIRGLQYICSSYLYLSLQSEEILLGEMARCGECSIRAEGNSPTDSATLEIPFCTFGMKDGGKVVATLVIEALDGQKHSAEFDVTSQVRDTLNLSHEIVIDFPLELKAPVQGGLDPSSEKWEENHQLIEIK